jgi:hypothetical protein
MNMAELVKHISEKEGKTSEVSVGNIREILGIVSDHIYNDFNGSNATILTLWENGKRRAKKKKK